MEREIQSLRFDLKNVHELKKKHALEGKYKMVRFFGMFDVFKSIYMVFLIVLKREEKGISSFETGSKAAYGSIR